MSTHPLRRLLRYARPHRNRVLLASTCSVTNKLFDLAPPLLIGAAIDVVVQKQDSVLAQWGVTDVLTQLWVLLVATVVIWGAESAFEYAFAVLWRNLAQTVEHEMRLDAYTHVQSLDMTYFEDQSTGELLSILNDDVNQLERFLDGGANQLIQVATTVICIGAAFFAIAPGVAALAMAPMPLVLIGSFWFQARIAPRYVEVRERVGLLNGQLAGNLTGVATVKSFTSEAYESARIGRLSEEYRVANSRAIRLSSAFSPLIRMVIVIGFAATLVYGGWLAVQGELNVGAYSVMVFLTQRLLWPLTRLGETFDLYQRAMASTTRVLDLLGVKRKILSGEVALPAEDVRGELVFDDVQFQYPSRDALVLDAFDLRIEAGQTVAIVGPTGAGKSTVVNLLLRFYEPTGGRVLLDGHPLGELVLDDLRKAIGLVSQSVFLFYGTVAENIAYGSFGRDRDSIIDAAKQAEAHDFISALPNGYDTMVGERGQKLSGGQRQRISLARAILKDPPVLILDEATSAVDNETEAAIQRSLDHVGVGRTVIVIAHRLSTIRNSDRIFVLEAGQLREIGTHDELVAEDGLYAQLWRVQTGQRAA
jgi:ATP-binding cassette, subfamily B, bacterial